MTQPEWKVIYKCHCIKLHKRCCCCCDDCNIARHKNYAAQDQAKKLVEWIDEKSKAEAKADGLDLEGCEEPNYWQRLKRDVGVE